MLQFLDVEQHRAHRLLPRQRGESLLHLIRGHRAVAGPLALHLHPLAVEPGLEVGRLLAEPADEVDLGGDLLLQVEVARLEREMIDLADLAPVRGSSTRPRSGCRALGLRLLRIRELVVPVFAGGHGPELTRGAPGRRNAS